MPDLHRWSGWADLSERSGDPRFTPSLRGLKPRAVVGLRFLLLQKASRGNRRYRPKENED